MSFNHEAEGIAYSRHNAARITLDVKFRSLSPAVDIPGIDTGASNTDPFPDHGRASSRHGMEGRMSVLTFPSVLTVSETTVAVIVDAFGRQVNTCQSGNSVVTFDARKS